jgi:hypothetical protein
VREAIEVDPSTLKINLNSLPSDVTLYLERDIETRVRLQVVFGVQNADFEAWVAAMGAEVTADEWMRSSSGAEVRMLSAEITTDAVRLLATCSEVRLGSDSPVEVTS